jgi:hypothetical protein
VVGLCCAGPALATSWADRLFEEVSRDFGSVPRGPTLSHSFRIVNKGDTPVTIASIRVSCGCVSATALKNTLRPGEETALVAQMDTSRFTGPKAVTIFVQFSQPHPEEGRLLVQANSRDDVMLAPDTLAFGRTRRGASPTGSVTVTFMGNPQAQVLDVRSESNYVQAAVKELRRQDTEVSYQLTARLRPDAPVGKWYTDVWLRTNLPAMPRVRVPLTVEIETALSVSPMTVLLGQVKTGGVAQRKVIVRGGEPFRITEVKGTDAQLAVRDSTTESKRVHVLTVTFRPSQPGELKRNLRVVTDLKENGDIDFRAVAQGVP